MNKPFAPSCENNKYVILDRLKSCFSNARSVLEVGSGTGQHAVFLAGHLSHLQWQPTELPANIAGIHAWLNDAPGDNIRSPVCFDVLHDSLPQPQRGEAFDAVFTANTLHIMPWAAVECLFGLLNQLPVAAQLCVYGPFNYSGQFTSSSNAQFDQWLKNRDTLSGIRNFEDVDGLATKNGFSLVNDYEMPANNRLLHWCKVS